MSAKQSPKSAAPSTPAAPPTGSPPEEKPTKAAQAADIEQGADAEEITAADIAAALDQLSDDPKAGQSNEETEATNEAPDVESQEDENPPADEAPADEAADESNDEPAESEDKPAESGDAAEEESGDVENEAEAEGEAPEADPKKVPPYQARINELTAKTKSLEESWARDRERLASYEAESSGRIDPGVLEHIDTPQALANQRRSVLELRQKLLRNPQGLELPDPKGQGKTISVDAERVAELLGETEQLLLEAIPAREQWLREREQHDSTAVNAYPWLKDTLKGAGAQVQGMLEKNPALRRVGPHYRVVAADALVGQTLREAGVQVTPELIAKLKQKPGTAKPAAIAQPAVRRTPPPAPAKAGVVPPRATARQAASGAAVKRLSKGDGNINDLTASIAANL